VQNYKLVCNEPRTPLNSPPGQEGWTRRIFRGRGGGSEKSDGFSLPTTNYEQPPTLLSKVA